MVQILQILQKFLNENVGVVTFLVGFIAIYLYLKQKNDRKRAAASLILQEIRYAEQLIRGYSASRTYSLYDRVLPTNSWNDSIHLFLADLEESEIDIISRFYDKAAYVDVLITKISDYKNAPPQTVMVPFTVPDPSATPVGVPTPQTVQIQIDPMGTTQKILEDTSRKVELVYNTPAGEKLKRIAKKKWYDPI